MSMNVRAGGEFGRGDGGSCFFFEAGFDLGVIDQDLAGGSACCVDALGGGGPTRAVRRMPGVGLAC